METALAPPREWTVPPAVAGPITEKRDAVLLCVIAGTATVDADGNSHQVAAGDAALIPPGVTHCTTTDAGAVVVPIFPALRDFPSLSRRVRVFTVPPESLGWLVHLFIDSRHIDVHRQDIFTGTDDLLNVLGVLNEISESGNTSSSTSHATVYPFPLPRSREALNVARILARNPASGTSANDFATAENISTRTLQRQFRDETGVTFTQWRTGTRIAAAARLLRDGRKAGWVAQHVGYATLSSFSRMFKEVAGMSPREFSRQARRQKDGRAYAGDAPTDAATAHRSTATVSASAPRTPTIPCRRTWTSVRPYHYLLWAYRGEVRIRAASRDITLSRGDAVWLPATVPHTIEQGTGAVSAPIGYSYSPTSLGVEDLTVFSFPEEAETYLLHRAVIDCTISRTEDDTNESFAHSMFRAQLAQLTQGADGGDNGHAVTRRSTASILLDYCFDLSRASHRSLDDWASRLGVPPATLRAEIISQTGTSFHQWRTVVRMDIARQLLRRGDTPGNVRAQLGYASTASFSNAFSTAHGISPRKYQERNVAA